MPQHYPFELPPLPYAYEALEPHISAETLHFHHDRHLKTYVDNLNHALEPYPAYHGWSLCRLVTRYATLPSELAVTVRNNAGGVYNHELYFNGMSPTPSTPPDWLAMFIDSAFGSPDTLRELLKKAALGVFGSGWAYLVLNAYGGLDVVTTPNQDTPLPDGLKPLLTVDVWEHAYYLQYQNLRANYFDNWFPLVDWETVARLYADPPE